VEYFEAGKPFEIGDIAISPFTVPHDAADPVGFVFLAEGVRMAYATDLGYIPPNVKAQLEGSGPADAGIEPRPGDAARWTLPLGSEAKGFFRGWGTSQMRRRQSFLEDGYDGQAAYVILAHLSESNKSSRSGAGDGGARAQRADEPAGQPAAAAMQHEVLSGILF